MKIRPTTPDDAGGRYRRMLIYVFDDDGWTDPEMLAKYVAGDAAVAKAPAKGAKTFVLTGTLQDMTRDEARALIESHLRGYDRQTGGPWGWKLCETAYAMPVSRRNSRSISRL